MGCQRCEEKEMPAQVSQMRPTGLWQSVGANQTGPNFRNFFCYTKNQQVAQLLAF